jgi:hypothetical protein
LAASAAPITSARSARRARPNTGNNMCVTPHPEHLDRRGRTRTTRVPGPPSTRTTAQPQGASRYPHPGHPRSPAASRRSTEPGSASTVSTAPPSATTALPALGQQITGRACTYLSSARCRRQRPHTTQPRPASPHQHPQRRSSHHSSASSKTPNSRSAHGLRAGQAVLVLQQRHHQPHQLWLRGWVLAPPANEFRLRLGSHDDGLRHGRVLAHPDRLLVATASRARALLVSTKATAVGSASWM